MPYETPVGFDPQAYINQYADLQKAGLTAADAAWHYSTYGKNEGRNYTAPQASQPVVDPYASLKTIYGDKMPTAWYEYASKPYYDINGELIQQSANNKLGGQMYENMLVNSKGQFGNQYYASQEEAARQRASLQQSALGSFQNGLVAGPTTPANQTASMLSNSGLNQANQGTILQSLYSNGYNTNNNNQAGLNTAAQNGVSSTPTTNNSSSNYQLYPEVDNSQYQKYNRGNRFFNQGTGMYSPFQGQTQQGTL
jgi:hypothetical protein